MKGFLILSVIVSVATARPNTFLRSSAQLPNVQTYASASATASAIAHPVPQQVHYLRLLPNPPLERDSRVLDSLELNLTKENQDVEEQRRIQDLEDERDSLNLRPRLLSSSLPSASLVADGRVVDTLEPRLANAAQTEQNERARWTGYSVPTIQSQRQEQNVDSLLSATRLAQSLAQVNAAGAPSRLQVLESPDLGSSRLQQQLSPSLRQDLPQLHSLPWIIRPDGQLLSSPILV